MEGISPSVPVSLSFVNPVCENSGISDRMELSRIKLETEAASLLSDPVVVQDDNSCSSWDNASLEISEAASPSVSPGEVKEKSDMLTVREVTENGQLVQDTPGSEEDEILSVGEDTSLITTAELLPLNPTSDISVPLNTASDASFPIAVELEGTENGRIVAKVISFKERSIKRRLCNDIVTVAAKPNEESASGDTIKATAVSAKLSGEKDSGKVGVRSIFELDCLPLWGSVSICGHRPEMEDAIMAAPHFMKMPIKMFIGDHGMGVISQTLSHLTSHFFGVYDGHGGSQVANYCRERIHLALVDELKNVKETPLNRSAGNTQQAQWEEVFTSCFLKVDDEVGGKASRIIPGGDTNTPCSTSEPVAPETVGSTAVVALVCSSHIIVSNCGDSRAVLYRGREAIALSVDHKPNRDDEYARIEASGGKVIQWNGHRVFGVLAMSRSIGDRYLKPWIIPEPEVRFVARAREDECLVIASDGLWDVMTNEEVCEVARKRLLVWHKRNGAKPLANRGQGVDPAAQEAAEYLSNLALQKGSKDNISIIVVDLKTQRKLKSKA